MDHSLLHLPSSDKIISSITQCRNLEEKYGLLDKLLSQLVYTDVNLAVKYVEKLKKINSFELESKVSLSYYWYKAFSFNTMSDNSTVIVLFMFFLLISIFKS